MDVQSETSGVLLMYIHLRDRGYLNMEELGAENMRHTSDIFEDTNSPQNAANARQVGGSHYKNMDIQPWDIIDQGDREQAIGFYRYNALKYIMRAGEKGEFKEDIAKAEHYIQKLLEILG